MCCAERREMRDGNLNYIDKCPGEHVHIIEINISCLIHINKIPYGPIRDCPGNKHCRALDLIKSVLCTCSTDARPI